MEQARGEVRQRVSIPLELRLCALAMGRLGASQMTYNSDLDLIFIYHLPDEQAAEGRVTAARIVQKLIAILEAPTREGYAYKLDLRLRPSGNSGPLVSNLEGFREYHRSSSALWERQALVRGRVIAGNESLGHQVELERQIFVYKSSLDSAGVTAIRAMRQRIEDELGRESPARLNLKQGPGGLVDIDFLAQMMALRYGEKYPALRARDTPSLLHAIGRANLMPFVEIESLSNDYRFLARLENRLRIESDHAVSALPTAMDALTPIARRAGYSGAHAATELLDDLKLRRTRIRTIFDACFAREAALL
jgi:glutamate-ammonia-ligase adenylyltransferase